MKHIEKVTLIFKLLALLVIAFGFNSCNIDEPAQHAATKTFAEYKTQLRKFIDSEKLFVDSCKVGYNINEFTPVASTSFDAFKAAYLKDLHRVDSVLVKADSAVQKLPLVTIADLVVADTYLSTNGKAFRGKINISDRRVLHDSITACLKLNDLITVGTGGIAGVDNVIAEDKTKFLTAISLAIVTRDAATTIDRQVKDALAPLNTARIAFLATRIPADLPTYISNSGAFITAQLTLVNTAKVGYNVNEYGATLKNNYLKVLNSAQVVVVTGATFAQVSTAMTTLTTPKTAFIPNVADKRALNDSVVADSTINSKLTVGTANGQISLAVQTNFKSALITATSLRENANSLDGQVKAGTYALTLYKNTVLASIPLHYAINTANILNTATLVGTTTGKVSQSAKTAFTTAITSATTIRDAKTTTVAQMNDALVQLEKARVLFTAFIVK
jgi:hypothetical protein